MGLVKKLASRNLFSDRFGTVCAIIGVALGSATVNVVLVLDQNTRWSESSQWSTNPDLQLAMDRTVRLSGVLKSGAPSASEDAKEETHEDYQVMRSAIRLGSLTAFLVGAVIVFFTFGVVIERRKKEIALLRSLGALPGQLARIFVLEAAVIGLVGALLGFLGAIPLSFVAAFLGITTTGRSSLEWLYFPWRMMFLVSAIGGGCALLGIIRPAREVLKLDVPQTLRPRFLESTRGEQIRSRSSLTLITLPFMALLYLLIRPFFQELLPSLTFFILEAGIVCALFLSILVLAPELIGWIGWKVARVLLSGPRATRLLVARRLEKMGHELAWSVSGVTLVFALLLGLHLATRSLKNEVSRWAKEAVRPYAYVYSRSRNPLPAELLEKLPKEAVTVRFSGRTLWPNAVYAAAGEELVRFAKARNDLSLVEVASRLTKGKVILSTMMARRFGLGPGDSLEVSGRSRSARLEVCAVTDQIGYMPMVGPYRNSKTYAILDSADFDLIQGYAPPIGAAVALALPGQGLTDPPDWNTLLAPVRGFFRTRVEIGTNFEQERLVETDRDFVIFDVILLLTTFLAMVGVANSMVLSTHGRQREIALYRVLGLTVTQLRNMFVLEGAVIGALGGSLAVLLGIPLGYAAISALKVISAFRVEFELPWSYGLLTALGAVFVAVIAALYPASSAAQVRSAESIHYE